MKFTTIFALLAVASANDVLVQFDDGELVDMTPEQRETALLELEEKFKMAPASEETEEAENLELEDGSNQPKTVKEVKLAPLTAKELDNMESTASETDADIDQDDEMDEDMDEEMIQ